jgi:type I restriction enzyme S subunit
MAGDLINGDIPEHWEFTTLGEICNRGGGGIQTGPFGSQLHASDYVPVGVPSIMPTNIGDNRIIEDGIVRITEDDANRLGQHRLRAGDIIYSRRGDVEKRALIREREEGWLCGTGCLKVRLGSGVVDPLFTSLFLGHPAIREWIVRHAVGATMPNLNTSIMSAVPFALPPLADQKRIAEVLGALDDKIELNRRMNATLEATARALFQSWFVDFDPVRAKLDGRTPSGMDAATAALFPGSFEESSLGHIPKGWETGSILRQADLLSGGTPKTDVPAYWNGDVPWASAKDVSQCGEAFLVSTERTITKLGVEESSTKIIPEFATVVVARGATTGRLTMFGHSMAMNQTCYGLRSKFEAPFAIYCHAQHFVERLVQGGHGSIFDTITTSTFEATDVVLAPKEVLLAFDKDVVPLFNQIRTNLHQSHTLATIRDTLLPKLLSGELSLKEAA